MTTCTYCGTALPDDTDRIIDHFYDAHVTLVQPPDVEALTVLDAEDQVYELEHVVAATFPPASRTGYFDTVLTDESAEHIHEWLSSTAIRLAESIDDEAEEQGWERQPESIRITVRVEPRWAE